MELFAGGYNCAQAVVGAFDDVAGVAFEVLMCLAAPLGGGVGRSGELCGAANGMAIAYGLIKGEFDHQDRASKREFAVETNKLVQEFKDRCGALRCHDLLAAGMKRNSDKREHCGEMVAVAVEILERHL